MRSPNHRSILHLADIFQVLPSSEPEFWTSELYLEDLWTENVLDVLQYSSNITKGWAFYTSFLPAPPEKSAVLLLTPRHLTRSLRSSSLQMLHFHFATGRKNVEKVFSIYQKFYRRIPSSKMYWKPGNAVLQPAIAFPNSSSEPVSIGSRRFIISMPECISKAHCMTWASILTFQIFLCLF